MIEFAGLIYRAAILGGADICLGLVVELGDVVFRLGARVVFQ